MTDDIRKDSMLADAKVIEAADALAKEAAFVGDIKMGYYIAKNGRQCSVEDGNGERCDIVPSDAMLSLEQALAAYRNVRGQGQ